MTASPRYFAIVPAAGRSVRMGEPKLLLPWRGSTIIQQTLAAWQASPVTRVIVVVRPDDDALAELVGASGGEVVIPPTPPPEMKASVLVALDRVRATASPAAHDAWLLAPADSPLLPSQVVDRLLSEHAAQGGEVLVPEYQGQRGHPVLFPWPFAELVAALPADEGINALVRRGPTRTIHVNDPTILADVDTPADYQHWLRRTSAEG